MPKLLVDHMADPKLSFSARVALFLLNRSRKADGYSYLTSAELGQMLGVGPQFVSVIARELTDAQLVRREPAPRGTGRRRWMILGFVAAMASQKAA